MLNLAQLPASERLPEEEYASYPPDVHRSPAAWMPSSGGRVSPPHYVSPAASSSNGAAYKTPVCLQTQQPRGQMDSALGSTSPPLSTEEHSFSSSASSRQQHCRGRSDDLQEQLDHTYVNLGGGHGGPGGMGHTAAPVDHLHHDSTQFENMSDLPAPSDSLLQACDDEIDDNRDRERQVRVSLSQLRLIASSSPSSMIGSAAVQVL